MGYHYFWKHQFAASARDVLSAGGPSFSFVCFDGRQYVAPCLAGRLLALRPMSPSPNRTRGTKWIPWDEFLSGSIRSSWPKPYWNWIWLVRLREDGWQPFKEVAGCKCQAWSIHAKNEKLAEKNRAKLLFGSKPPTCDLIRIQFPWSGRRLKQVVKSWFSILESSYNPFPIIQSDICLTSTELQSWRKKKNKQKLESLRICNLESCESHQKILEKLKEYVPKNPPSSMVPTLREMHQLRRSKKTWLFFTPALILQVPTDPNHYCWWFRNPALKPVEVGSSSHYLHGFVHPRRWRISTSQSLQNSFSHFSANRWPN